MIRRVAVALLLVLLAGCNSDPAPKEPQPSASTPTVTAPTMPAQAKENTPEGASAFVGYYIKTLNHASNTGDVSELSRISAAKCEGCRNYVELYRNTYANGGYFRDSDWELGELQVSFSQGKALVFGTVTSPPGTYAESETSPPEEGNATDSDLTFVLKRKNDAWTLDTLELQAS